MKVFLLPFYLGQAVEYISRSIVAKKKGHV